VWRGGAGAGEVGTGGSPFVVVGGGAEGTREGGVSGRGDGRITQPLGGVLVIGVFFCFFSLVVFCRFCFGFL